ncbi:unnamed protein product [Ectocarpus sp. CCAP 1310/34]|nr:unnamed protein product [Ectocarpus sp. CCAP 1310/34]
MEGASGGAGAPAAGLSTTVVPVTEEQTFPSRKALKVAVAAELAAQGRAMKNGSGAGSRQIHLVCKTCTSWSVKGCQQRNGDFKITKVESSHVDCRGGGRTSSAVMQPLVDQLVRANPKIGGPAIKRTLETVGFAVSDRTSQESQEAHRYLYEGG